MKAEWKKFIFGNVTQCAERLNAKHGFVFRYNNGLESEVIKMISEHASKDATDYLICEPQEKRPHDEMRTRWELTGQPVEWNSEDSNDGWIEHFPNWMEGCFYRFKSPKPKKVMKAEYFIVCGKQIIRRGLINLKENVLCGPTEYVVFGDPQEFDE